MIRRSISLDSNDGHDERSTNEHSHSSPSHRHIASGLSYGIGDVNLFGRYRLFHNSTASIALQSGLKAPTGATDAIDDADRFLDSHLQPGTGSWDVRVGVLAAHSRKHYGIASSLLYSINTTGKSGDDVYHYGNWLNVDITAKHQILSSDKQGELFLASGVKGEFRSKEEFNGEKLENTGGRVLYIAPGLQLILNSGLIIEASFLYPFYHKLNGRGQLGEEFKILSNINYGI